MLQSKQGKPFLSALKKREERMRKDGHSLQNKKRGRSYPKRSISYSLHAPPTYPHTCTSRFDCMTIFSPTESFFYIAKHDSTHLYI